MKILEVIPRFNPILGGGVDVVYNVSKQLCLFGHDVTIITSDVSFDADYSRTIEELGVNVVPFKSLFNMSLFIPTPAMKVWLNKHIKEYDIVHLNGTRSYQNNLVLKYARKYNIPYVIQAHGSLEHVGGKKFIKSMYDLIWGKRLVTSSTGFITLSNSEKQVHMDSGISEEKISIVPNGVDLSKFIELPEYGSFRMKYGIPRTEKVILYLGRLHITKGIDLLISAFSLLSSSVNHARLVIVGPDGGLQNVLQSQVQNLNLSDKVLFTGAVSAEVKLAAFVDSDVFVTPRFYGFPITFAESMACGLPIITTNDGDYLDFIDGNVGYSTVYSPEDISCAIKKILLDNDLSNTMRKNCRNQSEQTYNWKCLVSLLLCEYEKYISIYNSS